MNWECHNCGEQHDSLPAQCRSCGTAPEIVENVWRCASCGESGIGGTRTSCPSCGAEKGKEAQVAVDPSRRIEGERGRALAANAWRYCAYCKTQVPPVSDSGVAIERCPTCGGALSESTQATAREVLTAEEAQVYRVQKIEGESAPSAAPMNVQSAAPPTPPSKSGSVSGFTVFAVLFLFIGMCGYWLYEPSRVEQVQVSGKHWYQAVDIETMTVESGENWAGKVPASAHHKSCEPRRTGEREVFDHEEESFVDVEDGANCLEHSDRQVEVDVADGEESYTEREQAGKQCARQGFETNGGVSVKKCLEWEPKYEEVTRKRTKYRKEQQTVRSCVRYGTKKERRTQKIYRKEPIVEDFCRYQFDVWKIDRTVDKQGNDENPEWPATSELKPTERVGDRHANYVVYFKAVLDAQSANDKKGPPRVCSDEPCQEPHQLEKWRDYPIGKIMRVKTRGGRIMRFLQDGEEP